MKVEKYGNLTHFKEKLHLDFAACVEKFKNQVSTVQFISGQDQNDVYFIL